MESDKNLKMKKKSLIIISALIAITAIMCAMTGCSLLGGNIKSTTSYIDIGKVEDLRAANAVANNNLGSCVRVIAEYSNGNGSNASGFVVSKDGYVVTNRHCAVRFKSTNTDIGYNSYEKPLKANYTLVFANNIKYTAELKAYSTTADIAVLKIKTPLLTGEFQPVTFETQSPIYYGDKLYTIGNPENIGLILTELMVSAPSIVLNSSDSFGSIILDGNINHGNSGGPLFNVNSRVIGIVYARIDGQDEDAYGLGCGIPADTIMEFLDKNNIKYQTTPAITESGAKQ